MDCAEKHLPYAYGSDVRHRLVIHTLAFDRCHKLCRRCHEIEPGRKLSIGISCRKPVEQRDGRVGALICKLFCEGDKILIAKPADASSGVAWEFSQRGLEIHLHPGELGSGGQVRRRSGLALWVLGAQLINHTVVP